MDYNTAQVAVDSINYNLDKSYSYVIPKEFRSKILPGMRVLVPFGRSNQKKEGIVLSLCYEDDLSKLKPVTLLLDELPVLDEDMIKLILWMRKRTFCTFFDGAKAALPAGLWFKKTNVCTLHDKDLLKSYSLFDEDMHKVLVLFDNIKRPQGKDFARIFGQDHAKDIISRLCADSIITISENISKQASDKTVKMISLNIPVEEARDIILKSRNKSRLEVINFLSGSNSIYMKELTYMTGCSESVIRAMIKHNILKSTEQEIFRMPISIYNKDREQIILTAGQQLVFSQMNDMLRKDVADCAVLFGVTGSGKTLVYIKLIEEVLTKNKSAILLVPEISLTPQVVSRFSRYFGNTVAVIHSGLSMGEKYDQWKRVRSGQAKVIIGTRSAVFAPAHDIGVIIIDEEQDGAYRSENTPKYDAREIAKYRCKQNKCLLVLGSATPSVETYYQAKNNKYKMFTLTERFGNGKLPTVFIADMCGMLKDGSSSNLTALLIEEINKNLERNEQTILFLNRRGNSRNVKCMQCGYAPICIRCSVSMTYHSANNRNMCHYCGYSEKMPDICPTCGSRHLETSFAGTQKIEEELKEVFSNINIIRMDADTTCCKNSHQRLLESFLAGEGQILLGTQMVAKGLDFENVTLVGVLNADLSLYSNDYKSRERTFSLITQVIGRAGRHSKMGRAVIQTYSPEHPVILSGSKQAYDEFYNKEIELRGALMYPPFYDLLMFTLSADKEQDAASSAIALKARIESLMEGQFSAFRYPILGPVAATIAKLNNKYRYHVTIRCPDNVLRRRLVSGLLCEFHENKQNRKVNLSVDINSESF